MTKNTPNTYKYLLFFFIAVFVLIVGAVFYKLFLEVSQSAFTNNSFSILYVAEDSKVIYVDKQARKAVFLAVGDVRDIVKGKNNLAASLALGLPIHALIVDNNPPANLVELASSKSEMRLMFDRQVIRKYMNRYDIHKFIAAIKGAGKDDKVEKRINLTNKEEVRMIEDGFIDSGIINMPYTIEIDNGTSINGLGNELAKVLSKQGYNVIAVRTAKRELDSYIATTIKKDIYIESLMRLTGFEYKEKKISQAADITIFLGDDLEALLMP